MVGSQLPRGTVTFLFTDIEGSTKLLHELGPQRYAETLAEHGRALREAFADHVAWRSTPRATPSLSLSPPLPVHSPPPTRRRSGWGFQSAWVSTRERRFSRTRATSAPTCTRQRVSPLPHMAPSAGLRGCRRPPRRRHSRSWRASAQGSERAGADRPAGRRRVS